MSFRDLRRDDVDFAIAWDEALEQAKGNVESELHRRAVEGWEEPIYGGKNREQVVGTVRRYSDRLLELRAKALLPEYRDKSKVELGGGLDMNHGGQTEFHHVFSRLTREQRAALREVIARGSAIIEGQPAAVAPPPPELVGALPPSSPDHEAPSLAALNAAGAAVSQTQGGAEWP